MFNIRMQAELEYLQSSTYKEEKLLKYFEDEHFGLYNVQQKIER